LDAFSERQEQDDFDDMVDDLKINIKENPDKINTEKA